MIKRIQNHLLTHYPLLWNTRIVWALVIALITHIFFYIAGLGSITTYTLQDYHSISSIGGFGMYIFSILCGICFVIVWLVFYLRNNSYKAFYIIDRFHTAKEFLLIIIVLISFISFSESFNLGAATRIRSITTRNELVAEANDLNRAMTFIPFEKKNYFKLNDCSEAYSAYSNIENYSDTLDYNIPDISLEKIKRALKEPDAFSYSNFCKTTVSLGRSGNPLGSNEWKEANSRLIESGNRDSIRLILLALERVCKKYKIDREIPVDKLVSLVFENPAHEVTLLMNGSKERYATNNRINHLPTNNFLEFYKLTTALYLADNAYNIFNGSDDISETIFFKLYFVICFAILLFCYRLYSKRIFLFSLIGIIIWSIIFGLLGSSLQSEGLGSFYLLLFVAFFVIAMLSLRSNNSKLFSGILLNWHINMAPFILLIIVMLIQDSLSSHMSPYLNYLSDSIPANDYLYYEALKKYPFSDWVSRHDELLIRLNLLLVLLYTAFFFTSISRKWHISPEE